MGMVRQLLMQGFQGLQGHPMRHAGVLRRPPLGRVRRLPLWWATLVNRVGADR